MIIGLVLDAERLRQRTAELGVRRWWTLDNDGGGRQEFPHVWRGIFVVVVVD